MPKVIDLPTSTSMSDSDYLIMEASGSGTKKITRTNALSPIGTVVRQSNAAMSVPNNTLVDVVQISLPAGVWVVSAQVVMNSGGTSGLAAGCISTESQTLQAWSHGGYSQQMIPSAEYWGFNLMRILNLSATTTVYLVVRQRSGQAKNIDANASDLSAVRIK